mgnify:CR=1 FL=1|jgi:hypothetical protein
MRVSGWLTETEQAQVLQSSPLKGIVPDEEILQKAAAKIKKWHNPADYDTSVCHWLALMLDYLVEDDRWSNWVRQTTYKYVDGKRVMVTKEMLHRAVRDYALENNLERQQDPEWNIFDRDQQMACFAFLGETPYQQWVVCGKPAEDALYLFQEELLELAGGIADAEAMARNIREHYTNAFALWEKTRDALPIESNPSFLITSDGKTLPQRSARRFFSPEEIEALVGSPLHTSRLFSTPEGKTFRCYHRKETTAGRNEVASAIVGVALFGDVLVVPEP